MTVILVTGARALAGGASEQWARQKLVDILEWCGELWQGGCRNSPDTWAVDLVCADAFGPAKIQTFFANGGHGTWERLRGGEGIVSDPTGRWALPQWIKAWGPSRAPLERNAWMVDRFAQHQSNVGWIDPSRRWEVHALTASWSKTRGTERTADLAEAAGLNVTRHPCPEELRK